MAITSEIIFEVITLLITALSGVWYMANQLSHIRSRIDKIESTIEALKSVDQNCRDGRVQIWQAVNDERMKLAEIKARIDTHERNK